MNRFLIKFNRVISYILIALFIAMLITGYRSVGYFTFMSRGLANSLHIVFLNVSFIVLFVIHSMIGIRLALLRNKLKGWYIDVFLIVFGITLIGGFAYFAFSR